MIEVTAGILFQREKLLIAQRGEQKARPLQWELPGGKVAKGESLKNCLKRELFEEFGIIPEIGSLFMTHHHNYSDIEVLLHALYVNRFEGDIQLFEHVNIAWIDPSEFSLYKIAEADIPIIKKLAMIKG
jgi:8-oxo-dGTP diphosphatase